MAHLTRVVGVALVLAVAACSGPSGSSAGTAPAATGSVSSPGASTSPPEPTATPEGAAESPSDPVAFDAGSAKSNVAILASEIGARPATSPAFREAATVVAGTLGEYGYRVRRQEFRVPAGVSWGVPVPGGRTQNVLGVPQGFSFDEPFRIVGAHLDTVPQAPGGEDNASGVAVLLELARMASTFEPEVPVVFVAFGAEEPRGPGDDDHHFGSRHLVANLSDSQRSNLLGMVSLDRVGVRAAAVPVCYGGQGSSDDVQDELVRAARAVDVRVRTCENRASDHWPFAKAGLAAARVGGVPYPAYHSADDVAAVVARGQLARVGALVWAWVDSPQG